MNGCRQKLVIVDFKTRQFLADYELILGKVGRPTYLNINVYLNFLLDGINFIIIPTFKHSLKLQKI